MNKHYPNRKPRFFLVSNKPRQKKSQQRPKKVSRSTPLDRLTQLAKEIYAENVKKYPNNLRNGQTDFIYGLKADQKRTVLKAEPTQPNEDAAALAFYNRINNLNPETTKQTPPVLPTPVQEKKSKSFDELKQEAFIPEGKSIYSQPFKIPGLEDHGYFVITDHGIGNKHSFSLYGYSMGGPGGIPILIMRGLGDWYVYGTKSKERPNGRPAGEIVYGKHLDLFEKEAKGILENLIYEDTKTEGPDLTDDNKNDLRYYVKNEIKNRYGNFNVGETPSREKFQEIGNEILHRFKFWDEKGVRIPQQKVRDYLVKYINEQMAKYGKFKKIE